MSKAVYHAYCATQSKEGLNSYNAWINEKLPGAVEQRNKNQETLFQKAKRLKEANNGI